MLLIIYNHFCYRYESEMKLQQVKTYLLRIVKNTVNCPFERKRLLTMRRIIHLCYIIICLCKRKYKENVTILELKYINGECRGEKRCNADRAYSYSKIFQNCSIAHFITCRYSIRVRKFTSECLLFCVFLAS